MNGALIAGLLLGLAGSLHCVGMCGPLVLMMPSGWVGTFVYHLGRTITYTILGMVVGLMFQVVDIRAFQSEFSIAVGVGFLVMWAYQRWGQRVMGRANETAKAGKFQQGVMHVFAESIKGTGWIWRAIAGMANGLLPCGLVYGAMMAALGQGTTLGSMVLMAGFGLGTIPSLFVLSLLGHRISQGVRKTWSRWLPWWLLVMSVIFILRGMNLGIPFISPKVQTATHHGSCCRPN
jgi:sulfite exporter TauE/SafE